MEYYNLAAAFAGGPTEENPVKVLEKILLLWLALNRQPCLRLDFVVLVFEQLFAEQEDPPDENALQLFRRGPETLVKSVPVTDFHF